MTCNIRDYKRGLEGNFLAQTSSLGQKDGKPERLNQVYLLDSECKILKSIVSHPVYTSAPPQPINIGDSYGPELVFCPLNKEQGVYAISNEYKCYVVDSSGTISFIFTKNEPPQTFSKKDKDNIVGTFKKSIEKLGHNIRFTEDLPKHKPFFRAIQSDNLGRIYVHKYQIIPTGDRMLKYDLFNKEGYYLHKVNIPIYPRVIKNGYLYSAETSQDTGYIKIKRYKIKNWNQIKTGL